MHGGDDDDNHRLPYTPHGAKWPAWKAADHLDRLCALSGWNAADHLDRLCALSGWNAADLTHLAVWRDPEGIPAVVAAVARRIEEQMRWRRLVPSAAAVLAAVDSGVRPPVSGWAALVEGVSA